MDNQNTGRRSYYFYSGYVVLILVLMDNQNTLCDIVVSYEYEGS